MAKVLNRKSLSDESDGTFVRNQTGSAAVEFALIVPLLVLTLFGIIQFGIAFNNRVAITDGTRVAARTLSISRGAATPYTSARSHFTNSTFGLISSRLNIRLLVAGVECTSDGDCKNKLATAVGSPATVSATYQCATDLIAFLPTCVLTAQTSESVQ